VTSQEFRSLLSRRAANAKLTVSDDVANRLEQYFQLLARWNAKINLTAFPLDNPTEKTFDRLLIEPLIAARYVADSARIWLDVGSGGGSPAIPLKIAHPQAILTMVEAKGRKAAFLQEAVRTLELPGASVENARFQDSTAAQVPDSVDLVTVRAVRPDSSILAAIRHVMRPQGQVLLFHSSAGRVPSASAFMPVKTVALATSSDSMLTMLAPVFHVEQNG
jgi:16S rRNA (guanine527-N7)-methyltransferase